MTNKKSDLNHERLIKKLSDIQEIDDFKTVSKGVLKTKAILDICSEDNDYSYDLSLSKKRKI